MHLLEITFLVAYTAAVFILASRNNKFFEQFSRGIYLASFAALILILFWNVYVLFISSERELYIQHSIMCFCENFKPLVYIITIVASTALANTLVKKSE